MKKFLQRPELHLTAIFLLSLAVYLAAAYYFLAPAGYYGTIEAPRFSDPWIERGETIMSGGLLYRDVFTSTPPLTNFLLLPPVIVSAYFDHLNPGATAAFMVHFSLFNLAGALVLLYMARERWEGFVAAVLFLLNPLTFGNTVWRRQDESVVVFFIGLCIAFYVTRHHWRAAAAVGVAMLIKLTGAIFLPVAALHSRFDGRYFIVPFAVFGLVLAPFLYLAGEAAIFWDVSETHTEHPFQYGGVSFGRLWNDAYGDVYGRIPVEWASAAFVIAVVITGLYLWWRRHGVLEDTAVLLAVILIFSPKLHVGYYSMLVFVLAPLVRAYGLTSIYFAIAVLTLAADFFKWPFIDFQLSFWLMVGTHLMMFLVIGRLTWAAPAKVRGDRVREFVTGGLATPGLVWPAWLPLGRDKA